MIDLTTPTTRGVALRVTATLLAMALIVFALFEVKALGAEPAPRSLLPDLQQAVPSQLSVRTDGSGATPRFLLGFESAVDNVGEGPLTIVGNRASTSDADMTAEQRVSRSDGSITTRPGVGTLRFVTSPDHRHWHLLAFDRYELRRADDGSLFRPDQKTGFCLGDRRSTPGGSNLPGKPPNKVYTDECGRDMPELLTVTEGISVGYGDPYGAYLEGQQIEVTGAPAGRYVLVHRVNSDAAIEESDHGNNAASLLLELAWPEGPDSQPTFTVLRTCPGTDRCPAQDEPPPPTTEPPRSENGSSPEDGDRSSSQDAQPPGNSSDDRPEPDVRPLSLSFLRLSPVAFHAARSPTNVTYALSEAATVRFAIERAVRGQREGRRCVAPRRENRRAGPCTRYVLVGGFSRPGAAGVSGFRFRGRIGRHSLAPGAYRLAAVATTATGARSAPARASFRLLP